MVNQHTVRVEAEYKKVYSIIERPGAADLLQWMGANGFFEAPASKRHHGAKPGGLAEHSINVFRRLLRLNTEEEKQQQSPQYDLETVAICGLLHDLCKIDAYRKAEFEGITEYRREAGMTEGTYRKAGELLEKIRKLESFMWWCGGKREGGRKYRWVIVKLKRKWCGGVSEEEFELTDRLKMKICQCVEEEIELLKKELEELH